MTMEKYTEGAISENESFSQNIEERTVNLRSSLKQMEERLVVFQNGNLLGGMGESIGDVMRSIDNLNKELDAKQNQN